jgi:hypothetical protein
MITTTVRTVCALRMEGFVPSHFNVDSERRLVTVRFDNEVTVRDVVQYFESLKANPAFEPDFFELVDLTQVMSSEVDFQAAMMWALEVDPFSREARRAFVAPRAVTSRTIRMYQMARGDDGSVAVFRTMAEAKHWLDIEQSALGTASNG